MTMVGGNHIIKNSLVVLLLSILCILPKQILAQEHGQNAPVLGAQSGSGPDEGISFDQAMQDLAVGGYSAKKKAIVRLGEIGDERALVVLEALANREYQRIKVDKKNNRLVLIISKTKGIDPISGEKLDLAQIKLSKPRINNSVVRKLKTVIPKLQFNSKDANVRLDAAKRLVKDVEESYKTLIEQYIAKESDHQVRSQLQLALAILDLQKDNPDLKLKAIAKIESMAAINLLPNLQKLVEKDDKGGFIEPSEQVRVSAQASIRNLESRSFWYNRIRDLIFGLSSGSILLLMALGLAITFGLMGVINMAHGEMLMLGAYTAYSVQELFSTFLPDLIDWYVIAALPVAFVVTAAIGMALERSVIRLLYGRPLDTLLVTWGISMIIIQIVRLTYGAANVTVANPSWLTGGAELLPGQIFPYARLAAIVFAILIVILVWYLLSRTSLGLKVRAVQQNRSMAACMGINTAAVDMWTFGLGAGIAGLAGVALSQILLVGPNLGQSLIIESFMVVVTGGVGNIAGTVAGAYGLGVLDKFIEPVVGPAMVKVCLLVFIILFIQWRPEGLFPPKGRVGET